MLGAGKNCREDVQNRHFTAEHTRFLRWVYTGKFPNPLIRKLVISAGASQA